MKRFRGLIALAITSIIFSSQQPHAQAAPNMAGFWRGTLLVGAQKLQLVMQMTPRPDGTWRGQLYSLDQGKIAMAIDEMSFRDGALKLQIKAVGGTYEGKLSPDSTKFTGQWMQGTTYPLELRHVATVPELARPQDPQQPYPYTEAQVNYTNAAAGIKLAGTLTIPPGPGPFPTVILIPDASSAQPRNRNDEDSGHRPFLVWADYLARQGFAVLRSDDRGTGDSGGDATTATLEDHAADAMAALDYLKTRQEVDAHEIGLLGHGQGGLVASLAALLAQPAFIVLLAAPGVTGQELASLEAFSMTKAMGMDNGAAQQSLQAQAEIFDILDTEKDPTAASQQMRAIMTRIISKNMPPPPKPGPERDQYNSLLATIVDSQVKMITAPATRFLFHYDPQTALRQLQCPVLALNGDLDPVVPATPNLSHIEQALKAGHNKDYKVQTLPKINHQFQTAKTASPLEQSQLDETVAPEVLKLVGDWMQQRVL